MDYCELSCANFVRQLASASPVPGGGGASALMGALGTALGNMVGSLTMGKKKYADVQSEIESLKARSDALQEKFLQLVEKDAEVFEPLSRAYGLPRETEEQCADKARVMEKALREAAQVPLEVMKSCEEAFSIIGEFAQKGTAIAISDAGVAAVCCRAALQGASLNVFINTKAMTDRMVAEQFNREAEVLLTGGCACADEIFLAVRRRLC